MIKMKDVYYCLIWWPMDQLKPNAAAARSRQDLRTCRRSGAETTLIRSLPYPIIRLSQWGCT